MSTTGGAEVVFEVVVEGAASVATREKSTITVVAVVVATREESTAAVVVDVVEEGIVEEGVVSVGGGV